MGPLAALAAVPLLFIGGCVGSMMLLTGGTASADESCGTSGASGPGVVVDLKTLPRGPIAGYRGDDPNPRYNQLLNAAYIMNAGQALGLDVKWQTTGVMTSMGESSLQVLDRGDKVGPDSRGLFQQRANGAWGSYADRMNPTISATNFFKAMMKVPNWPNLSPTEAAHLTQRNADPRHYDRHWDPAVQVVNALAGTKVTGVAPGTGTLACTETTPTVTNVAFSTSGWTQPTIGPITSHFGPRDGRMHNGTDIGAACGKPIYAVNEGTVVGAGPVSGYGNLITIDHGGGVVTRYAHMYNSGVLVRTHAKVAAGQEIGRVGNNGNSSGCHLHFEVMLKDQFTDAVPFMSRMGVRMGLVTA